MNGISNPMNGTDEESNGIPALLLSEEDNVVTLLSLAERGDEVRILSGGGTLAAADSIPLYHKMALRFISRGETVLKYGVAIGRARQDIPAGAWVHLHNLESFLDEKSSFLDLHTGVDTGRRYE
ncbi:MAG: UxaA family hydrolase [Synergistaceae bacterium]|jgi:altronate dehydratase|nr:UxaA family hydrolase [Synergistaceae bacterium]